MRHEAKFGLVYKFYEEEHFFHIFILNLNFDTQFKEFDVGNKVWKHKVSKKQP